MIRWSSLGYLSDDEIEKTITQQIERLDALEKKLQLTVANLSPNEQQQIKSLLNEYKEWLSLIQEVISKDKSLVDIYFGSADETLIFIMNSLEKVETRVGEESSQYFVASTQNFTQAIVIFFVVFSLSIAASILVVYFFSRSIIMPINYLAKKVTYISTHRDLSEQIEIRNKDEIWVLADAFNGMIKSLKVFYDQQEKLNSNLELKVNQRTSEISLSNESLKDEINERKQIEVSLRESEEAFRHLFEYSGDAIILREMGKYNHPE